MFSYRHGFHAGNHADVLKHATLAAVLMHLTAKEVGITVVDTHAGAGRYRLDGQQAGVSGEAQAGVLRLLAASPQSALLRQYLDLLQRFNPGGGLVHYPGSPAVARALLRAQDRLALFELHPTDARALHRWVCEPGAPRLAVGCWREDGFEGLKRLLPPPSRRGLLLIDPSYEIKTDYLRVPQAVADALRRFPTGVVMVWYPVIGRTDARDLPRRLKGASVRAGRPWLQASLTVKGGRAAEGSLPGSGLWIVNPPHTLRPALSEALPELVALLGQDRNAAWTLQCSD